MTVFIGTSGWQYRDWRPAFYPPKLPQKDWLPYYADRFAVVEVNNTFYNLPHAQVFQSWRERTPADFLFAPKLNRYLTHLKRLKNPEVPIARFTKAARELKEKLGPILMQLPPGMDCDIERLERALTAFPRDVRIAVEFRDDSWYIEPVRRVLSRHDAALCLTDRAEELSSPDWRTTDWGYIRFHSGEGRPRPCYTEGALRAWANRIASTWDASCDVFAFFNNDSRCCAVNDARRLAAYLAALGRDASRVPCEDEVTVVR